MPGVWKAAAHNEGCAVIYHAPHACAHITDEMERNRHFRTMVRGEYRQDSYTAPLITSGIGRTESVFGGIQKLEDCIAYVAKHFQPAYIIVTDSCIAGVMGDDTASVCEAAEQQLGIPVLYTNCHGFLDGEYYGGYVETSKLLIDKFMRPGVLDPQMVTIIGEKDGPSSLAVRDFCELLKDFGLVICKRFPGYCSIEEMEQVSHSSFTMVLGGTKKSYKELRKIADYMTEKLNIPHFAADYPIGWRGTCEWVERLGAFTGRENLVQPTLERLWQELSEGYGQWKDVLRQTSVVLCLGQGHENLDLDWVLEWITLGKLPLERIIFMDQLTDVDRQVYSSIIKKYTALSAEEESSATVLLPEQFVLTTHELMHDNLRQLLLPMLPPVGTAGFLQMYRKLYMLARRSEGKGVVLYGW